MQDADPRLSKTFLALAALGAALNLADSARTSGPRSTAGLFPSASACRQPARCSPPAP